MTPVTAGEAFLKTPGLKIRDVDGALLPYALEIIKRYHLENPPGFNSRRFSHPRRRGEIVSTDIHFGKAEGLQRRSFTQARDKKQSND
ncbi:MAG: hypothetical protein JRN09_07025 [Nitrososphaerota archaeon]|nr:hypothetical protein [Nitrososphaerota archaeon]